VAASQIFEYLRSPRTTDACASTMNSDDMSSTNVDAEVTGMSRMGGNVCPVPGFVHASCGNGPTTDRPL
jgi:hypothetical protein